MVEAAAANGWINREPAIHETLTSHPAGRCRHDLELLGPGVAQSLRDGEARAHALATCRLRRTKCSLVGTVRPSDSSEESAR